MGGVLEHVGRKEATQWALTARAESAAHQVDERVARANGRVTLGAARSPSRAA